MTPATRRPLSLVGAPSSAGAYGPGQELAPDALRRHGLGGALRAAGVAVTDRGDGRRVEWRADPDSPHAANPALVASVAQELADTAAEVFAAGEDLLVLGGDCTIELGTVAGARRDGARVGLVYVDFDADLHTPETGDGILDWMGAAHLLGLPGAHPDLAGLDGAPPMLSPGSIRFAGTDNITPAERRVVDQLDLHVESLAAVRHDLAGVLERTRAWAEGFDRVLVHVDADVLDAQKFAIAENNDPRGGLELDQLTALLAGMRALPGWCALTLCEVNPARAAEGSRAVEQMVDLLVQAVTVRA